MLRALLSLWGLVVLLVPRRVVDTFEPIAFDNPDDAELRSWTLPIARLEGLVLLFLATRDDAGDGLAGFLGLAGIPALVAPGRYLDWGLSMAYENPEDVAVKSWVVPVTRVLGAVYLLVALGRLLGSAGDVESETDATALEH